MSAIPPPPKTGAAELREALRRTGMSKSRLARLIGMSPQAVGHWCKGSARPQPDILAWVVRLGMAIEKHPPPKWRPNDRASRGAGDMRKEPRE
jgi:transcriptional regulator with XRE-family HTH domain